MEIGNQPDKEFKVMNIKTLTELRTRMDEHSEKFNKELENRKKNQTELKNTIPEIKNRLERINNRLEEWISELEDRVVKTPKLVPPPKKKF